MQLISPKVYVGTYAKYNNGSIKGKWLNLDDYDNAKDFWTACKELHKDEVDPEFDFQDYEGINLDNISIEDYYEMTEGLEEYQKAIVLEYLEDVDSYERDAQSILDRKAYDRDEFGHNLEEDFGYRIAEDACLEIPDNIKAYFDYEAYGRDALSGDSLISPYDFTVTDNYIFENY